MKNYLNFIIKIIFIFLLLNQITYAKDPLNSPVWQETIKTMISNDKYIFDDKNIKINVPSFADNPLQVPIFIDATKIKAAKRMLVFADLNAIVKIADFDLIKMKPILSLNIKIAQGTPLRAVVLDKNGLWHVGSAQINSFGGGCSVSSVASTVEDYEDLIGRTKSNIWKIEDTYRIKWSVFHPMQTGLFVGDPSFYISDINILSNEKSIGKMKIFASVSENPRILLETKEGTGTYKIKLLDTDSNEFNFTSKL